MHVCVRAKVERGLKTTMTSISWGDFAERRHANGAALRNGEHAITCDSSYEAKLYYELDSDLDSNFKLGERSASCKTFTKSEFSVTSHNWQSTT